MSFLLASLVYALVLVLLLTLSAIIVSEAIWYGLDLLFYEVDTSFLYLVHHFAGWVAALERGAFHW